MDCLRCIQSGKCECSDNSREYDKNISAAQIKERLTGSLIGLSRIIEGKEKFADESTAKVVVEGLFATLTNIHFDNDALWKLIESVGAEKQKLLSLGSIDETVCGRDYDMVNLWNDNVDIRSLKSMILLGIRGISVYASHAAALGYQNETIHQFLYKALRTVGMENPNLEELFSIVLEAGKINLQCMEMMDKANKETYGKIYQNETDQDIAKRVGDAMKAGKINHFFMVAGCDKARAGRNYYTEFVEKTPSDSIVMTLSCGNAQFDFMNLGTVAGLPRLMEIGRCNDAYAAIQIATKLAESCGSSVSELPLSMVLSWYEQKAVCVLLTLMYLGIRNIRLGPSLPTFISQNILKLLLEKYNIALITTPEEDLKAMIK